MRILIAPDKFKGSLGSEEICRILEAEFSRFEDVQIVCCPISDGGDGFSESLQSAMDGQSVTLPVQNAMGEVIDASYVRAGNVAILEMARASGLAQIHSKNRDPWQASTYGTGEMLRHAMEFGATKILMGIGGSATNDGGTGMALALGWRFLDNDGNVVTELPAKLLDVRKIEAPDRTGWPEIQVACDVENPLLGEQGCTRVYGPQKGVREAEFKIHEERLAHLVSLMASETQAEQPGSGAAGGLGFGLMVFANAVLKPGFELVAEALDLQSKIRDSDLVVTAEGRLDASSLMGKAPVGLARMAQKAGRKTMAFCGQVDQEAMPELSKYFADIRPISPPEMSAQIAMANAPKLLSEAAAKWAASHLDSARGG